jgi:hypothetical protein
MRTKEFIQGNPNFGENPSTFLYNNSVQDITNTSPSIAKISYREDPPQG